MFKIKINMLIKNYLSENTYEAIIDRKTWELVQGSKPVEADSWNTKKVLKS